jgi:RecB family exonuclease
MPADRFPWKLSPSSIDLWRQCPRRAYFQEVEQRPCDQVRRTFEQTLGEVVHDALEWLFRVEPALRSQDVLVERVGKSVPRLARRAELHEVDQKRLHDEALRQLLAFAESSDLTARPRKLEHQFQLRLTNGTIIKTRVDRVDRADSGVLEVIDYKSGRNQLEERELAYETAPIVELLAISTASNIPVERVTWHYLRSGDRIDWWPEDDDVEAATDRLLRLVDRIQRDTDYEPNPGPQCIYCPFSAVCPAWSETGDEDTEAVA